MYGEKKYAEIVLLDLILNKTFHYHIPPDLKENITIGATVLVPFKNKVEKGCVVGLLPRSTIKNCKEISQIIDKIPLLNSNIINLTKWISNYYLCPWGRVLNYTIPESKKSWRLKLEKENLPLNNPLHKSNYNFSKEKYSFSERKEIILNEIEKSIIHKESKIFFLHSDNFAQRIKVYSRSIESTLEVGRQVIIITPTKYNLSELAKFLEEEFKEKIIIFDEKINHKNRYLHWNKIVKSKVNIALGMRSTIFVPFNKLGLIIVDQEHDSLYKEERTPRYNAREVALKRAKLEDIPVILSSETPSLESYRNVLQNKYINVDFNLENKKKNILENKIVDMTKEKSKKKIISYELQQAILKSLKREKQVVLFLNRRGFSSFVMCNKCGFIPKCPDCNNTLSYHLDYQKNAQLICHSCGKRLRMLDVCPECGSKEIRPLGIGTQRLESEIRKMFPQAIIRRLDRDSIINKEDYRQTIEDFNKSKIDILIGTTMVMKSIDFSNVDLMGIVSADTLMNLPDYRSGEKTFQLINEIISYFKKMETSKEIIIQTFNPEHYCIIALEKEDYNFFYKSEIKLRKELNYPPFTHIIKIEVRGEEKDTVKQKANILINYLNSIYEIKEAPKFELLGSKNMVIWKSKTIFRVQILIKVKNLEKFNKIFRKKSEKILLKYFNRENRLIIDVDPIKMI